MVPSLSYFLNTIRPIALLAAVVLSVCTAVPVDAGSCSIVVVRSAQLQPHLEVVRGIRDACECSVREVTLRSNEGSEKVLAKSPNIVITVGTSGLKKLKEITTLPLIYAMAVPSEALRCQGANISGVSMDLAPASHVATMHDIFPDKRRIGVIYDPRNTGAFFEEAVKAARAAGLELISQQVHDPSRLPAALSAMRDRIDIFWMLPDPSVVTTENVDLLLRFSFQEAVPIFTFSRKYVDMGAVASLDLDPYDIGVQVGELANRLNAGSGAVREYARMPRLTVNRNVAGKMGIAIKEEIIRKVKKID
jgi:putative ABC transport system substrate-binding protein